MNVHELELDRAKRRVRARGPLNAQGVHPRGACPDPWSNSSLRSGRSDDSPPPSPWPLVDHGLPKGRGSVGGRLGR
jgi:hypothetical protein